MRITLILACLSIAVMMAAGCGQMPGSSGPKMDSAKIGHDYGNAMRQLHDKSGQPPAQ